MLLLILFDDTDSFDDYLLYVLLEADESFLYPRYAELHLTSSSLSLLLENNCPCRRR